MKAVWFILSYSRKDTWKNRVAKLLSELFGKIKEHLPTKNLTFIIIDFMIFNNTSYGILLLPLSGNLF